jgi:hypothetical protein
MYAAVYAAFVRGTSPLMLLSGPGACIDSSVAAVAAKFPVRAVGDS